MSMGHRIWRPEGLFPDISGSRHQAGCIQRVLKSPAAQEDQGALGLRRQHVARPS